MGQDLHARVRVPVTTAVLGGEAEVPNLGGRRYPASYSSRDPERPSFRLKGKGMPLVGKRHEFGATCSRDVESDFLAS